MTLRTGIIIGGDATGAIGATDGATDATNRLTDAQRQAAAAAAEAARALVQQKADAAALAREQAELAKATLGSASAAEEAARKALANAQRGTVRLTEPGQRVSIDPATGERSGPAPTVDAERVAAAQKALAEATRIASQAQAEFNERLAAAQAAARAAAEAGANLSNANNLDAEAARKAAEEIAELARRQAEAAAAAEAARRAAEDAGHANDNAGGQTRNHTNATNDNTRANERNAFGMRNLGQQFGDLAVMVQGGIDPVRAFATQAGQMGYALSEMGGKVGALGSFLVGPWGIALTIAATTLAPLIEGLFKAGEAAEQAKIGASGLGDAQSLLGEIFGKTSSKIAEQTELLRIRARVMATNLAADARAGEKEGKAYLDQAGLPTIGRRATASFEGARDSANLGITGSIVGALAGSLSADNPGLRALAERARKANALGDSGARQGAFDKLLVDARTAKISPAELKGFEEAVGKLSESRLNALSAASIDRSLDTGKLDAALVKPTAGKQAKRAKADTLPEFGRDAGDKLAGIIEQFSDTPPALKKVDAALRQISDLEDDLERKSDKKHNFAGLIADAERAKVAVREGLNKPFNDYIAAQQRSLQLLQLAATGHEAEAEAARVVQQIEQQQGPLDAAHKAAILASVEALAAEQRQIDINRAHLQPFLEGLGSIQGIVEQATQAFVRGDLGQLVKSPGKLLDAFQTLKGQQLFDKMFDGVFRDLQDQLNGVSPVQDAAQRMADAVDVVTQSAQATASALNGVAAAARGSAGGAAGAIGAEVTGSILAMARGILTSPAGDGAGEVVVQAHRDPARLFEKAIGGIAGSIAHVFTNEDSAKLIGANIGKYAGKGLEGAATGSIVAGLGKSIGVDLNKGGAQLGGAIGGILGSIKGVTSALGPFGAALTPALSVLGGLVGGLFGHKASNGSAGIAVTNGQFGATAGTGASAELAKAANGLAGNVAGALQQIADQLGGGIGGTGGITIGTNNGNYHVNAVGGTIGKKGSGDVNFGKDGDAAVAYALQQEIAQGAISGLSEAVQRALRSSSDVNGALKEALKVQQVELLVGGMGATIAKQFRDLEAQAKDRLRIATQYGFDVVAIEKKNAEDRTKLAADLAKAQVGSLQSLVDELTTGSLFEGSALDKLGALADPIAKALADLDAGVDGAADKLASLEQQKIAAAKDAYGTTAGFADARAASLDEARAAIARANAQIATAQARASDPALATTNRALDENNDQNAEMITALDRQSALLERMAAGGSNESSGTNLYALGAY